jgi:uncharacterized protein (DUF1501 family)
MGALARLYREGRVAVLQGVGAAGASRDHEVALRSWQTADIDPVATETGWLGRAADRLWRDRPPIAPAVFVGSIPRPHGLNAANTVVPSVQSADQIVRGGESWDPAFIGTAAAPRSAPARPGSPPALVAHVRRSLEWAREASARVAAAERLSVGGRGPGYPACALGRDLRVVAALIRAELGVRIFHAELGGGGIGGFDNHANQLGNHCALLDQLANAAAAFAADLAADGLLDRVLLLTFSEFGRTVAENGRRGTDHGAAGPVLVVGGGIRGGVHGAHPSLTDLDQGALKHHTDFRSVYATAIGDWLGLPADEILGGSFARLPFVAAG